MKKILYAALAVMILPLLLVSCDPISGEKPEPTDNISLSATSVMLDNKTLTTGFTIISKVDWTLSADSEWITPSVGSGTANTTVKVVLTIEPNGSENQRTGTVTVSADGEEPVVFTLRQSGTGKSANNLTGINKWIYDELCGWYYWNDAVKDATLPANSLAYDKFLSTLVLGLKDVEDKTTTPYTIDGGYDVNDNRYVYSYIERSAATRASANEAMTFGFDVTGFRIDDYSDKVALLVTWVRADSPAYKSGIRRGTWLYKYSGGDITYKLVNGVATGTYPKMWDQLHNLVGGNTMSLTDEDGKAYSLTATTMSSTPIIYNKVLSSPKGRKVAYMVYNEFKMGENGEFNNDLRTVFGEFKSAGVEDLVLDLRYNGGGAVESCRILTSLAGNVSSSQVFAKLQRNKEIKQVYNVANPEIEYFRNEANSLKRNKIYVLATGSSASASEMVINALRGVLGDAAVVHIGATTEGKNVGMDLRTTTLGGYKYEMWPITFKIMNAENFCDYAGGFTPNYYKNEFWDITSQSGSGIIYELGDQKERLLAAAMTLIDGGSVTPDTATRAAGGAMTQVSMPRDPGRGGAKYIPKQ